MPFPRLPHPSTAGMMLPKHLVPSVLWGMALPGILFLSGCASYHVGAQTLYRPDIQTIHVPLFESNSFRRQLGEQLTEAVVKELQLKTPYQVVCEADADSRLSGRILTETKQIQAEDINDVPRDIRTTMNVQIRWETRQGDLLRQTALPLPPSLQITQTSELIPEGGQSIATAHQRAIAQLAEQIVAQLEYPAW